MNAVINMNMLLSFALTAAVIIVVPGPSVMFIVSRALAVGRPSAIAAAAGNSLGMTSQGVFAAFGLGSIIGGSPVLFSVIKWVGALYLTKMGVKMLRHRELSSVGSDSPEVGGLGRDARQGFLVGVTNPKIVVFFAAVLPQFVDRSLGYVVPQMMLMLAIFGIMSLVSDTSWGFAGGSIRNWSATSPQRMEWLIGGGGVCIILVAVALTLSHSVG